MAGAASTIIKKSMVKAAGTAQLGDGGPSSPGGAAGRARIVNTDEDGALVEVVCPCGQKLYLRCICAGAPAGELPAPGAADGG